MERDIETTVGEIEGSWEELTKTLAQIPEARQTEPGVAGDWSIKDIVGHLAYWAEECVRIGERCRAGEPENDPDWRVVNDQEAARRASLSVAAVRAELEEAHGRRIAFLRSLNPDQPRTVAIVELVAEEAVEHGGEHLAEIRAWWEKTAR